MDKEAVHPFLQYLKKNKSFFLPSIFLLAILLRLIRIQSRGIWYDDAFSILLSGRSLGEIVHGTAADTMPPLYYFLLHFWMKLGSSIWWIRSLNLLLDLVVIYILYRLTKEMAGEAAGLLAAFFAAISPFQIYHSQEIRMYILLELSLLGSYWMFFRLAAHPGWKYGEIAAFILFGALALYSHNLAIFTLAGADVYLLIDSNRKKLGQLIAAQAAMVLCFVPWLILVPGQIQKIQTAFWTPRPGLVEIIQAMDTLLGSLPQHTWVLIILTVLCVQVVILFFWQAWKNRKDQNIQFLMVIILIPPILLLLASYLMRPVFVPRAMIASGLVFYAALGVLIVRLLTGSQEKNKKVDSAVYILMGLTLVVSVLSLPNQYLFSAFPRSPFKELDQSLAPVCPVDSCLVLHDNKLSYFPAILYDGSLSQRFMADASGTFNDTLAPASQDAMQLFAYSSIDEATKGYMHVYFVTFQKALDEYKANGKTEHPSITLLKQGYRLTGQSRVGDLVIYEFVR
jgi:mannosyltransferase